MFVCGVYFVRLASLSTFQCDRGMNVYVIGMPRWCVILLVKEIDVY